MCGIIGVIGQKISIESDIKGRLLESIAHRGPDGNGSWESSNPTVWLGHTRLSILDLTDTASQPMLSDCGRWVLVFNGEIFNFLELRADLIKRGFSFRTESDTEVLLKGLICFGQTFNCNAMACGLFVFGIVSSRLHYLGEIVLEKNHCIGLDFLRGLHLLLK
jgi:asparagine synthase (glutamine-hydrolysing)